MDGLQFQAATPPARSDPARADIALFVGFVAPRRRGAELRRRLERALRDVGWDGPDLPPASRVLPADVLPGGTTPGAFARWLERSGWRPGVRGVAASDLFRRAAGRVLGDGVVDWWIEYAWHLPFSGRSAADLLELADVPVPIDTWDAFDALFAWEQRPLVEGTSRTADTSLGAAVRRFFLHGGRKAYVVSVGDPWPVLAGGADRAVRRLRLLETLPPPSAVDRSTWRGVAHLFGLSDVSFLCLPDLPEIFAVHVPALPLETDAESEERFLECATRMGPPTFRSLRSLPMPRCDETGFVGWASFVADVGGLLGRSGHLREVQFVAAVPLPANAAARQWQAVAEIQTAFVQLAYPWLRTTESERLPGGVEPPDAMLAGLLAGNALLAGTWRSLAREPVFGLTGLEPELSRAELEAPLSYHGPIGSLRAPRTLRQRVSIFAASPTGFQLLSDVTTDDDEAYRPANVNRLVSAIVRAARLIGEDATFANNGEAAWRRLRSGLELLLLGLWGQGALAGATAREAFEVRCDRSTMTQADLDAGRAVVRVQFLAAGPIDQIVVILAMDEGGQVTLLAPAAGAAA